MKTKIVLPLLAVVVLLAAAGGWYVFLRPHDRLALARSLMSKGDIRGAQLELRNIVLSDPANAEAHFRLGEVQLAAGDPIAADRELTQARARGWSAQALAAPMAQALLAERRFDDVLKISDQGLDASQKVRVLVARAQAQLALGTLDAARDTAAQAQATDPHAIDAAMAAASVARVRGDQAGTDKALDQALAIDPHAPAPLLLRSQDQAGRGDLKDALANAGAAVAAAPGSLPARLQRAQILIGMHQGDQARPDLDAIAAQDPRNPAMLFLRAQVLAQARDFKGADEALSSTGLALPHIPRGLYLQALVKAALNQPEQAMDAASRYLAATPADPAAYVLMARLDLLTRRPTDAADVLNRAVAEGHGTAEVMDLLGQTDSQLGRGDQAVQAEQQAATLSPNDPSVLSRLASLKMGAGDPGAAAQDLQHLVDILPAQPAAAAPAAAVAHSDGTVQTATQSPPPNTGLPGATPTLSAQQAAAALVGAALQAGDVAKARAALDRVRQLGGTPTLLSSLDALIKLSQLDFPGAQASFEAAVKDSPDNANLKVELARVLGMQGKVDESRAVLEQAVAQDHANPAALTTLVTLDFNQNRPADAVAAMEAAHAAQPQNLPLLTALADVYTRAKQPQKAIDLLEPALAKLDQAKPAAGDAGTAGAVAPSAPLLAAKVRAQLALGQRHEAIATVRQLLTMQPGNVTVRRELADMLAADNQPDAARAELRDGLSRSPGSPELLGADIALATRSGGMQAGLARADELALDPANLPAAKIIKGDLYAGQRQFAEAAATYRDVLTDQSPPGFAVRTAVAERQAGQTGQATTLLHDWLAKHPDALEVAAALASFEITDQHLDDARKHLEQVVAKRPNDAASLNNLAWVLQQQNDAGRAEELARRSWLLSPLPQTADTLGWILASSGKAKQSLDLLRGAASALPGNTSIQYHYAVALKDTGQEDAARPILDGLVKRPDSFPEKADAKRLLDQLSHS